MNTLVYSIEKTEHPETLYINLTNACTNNCVFCLRTQKDDVCGKDMWLDNEKITLEDVIAQFKEFTTPSQVVFCGYGEPMIKLDLLKDVAHYLRINYPQVRIRVNTNGHANAIHKKDVLPELVGLIDGFSVSLNGADEQEYNELSKPNISNAFESVKSFIGAAVENGFDVTATMVSGFMEGKPDVVEGQKIAEGLGAKFRIREFITNGY
jgi:TatD DNase family protein